MHPQAVVVAAAEHVVVAVLVAVRQPRLNRRLGFLTAR
jgi:hypothetical protein